MNRLRTLTILAGATFLIGGLHLATVEQRATGALAQFTDCSDGIDNDHDGYTDYPQDTDCDSLQDTNERANTAPVFLTITDGKENVEPGGKLVYRIGVSTDRTGQQEAEVHFLLPHQTNLISASTGGRKDGNFIVWNNVRVNPGAPKILSVELSVKPSAEHDLLVVSEVTSGGSRAVDTTRVVRDAAYQEMPDFLSLSITDGKVYAVEEDLLQYRILVRNKDKYNAHTVDVRAQVPAEIVLHEVSGRHTKDGRELTWGDMHLGPGEVRELFVTGHVERDVPDFYTIRFKVYSGSEVAVDHTTIGTQGAIANTLNLQVTDGQQGARNGDIITYSVHVENPTGILATNLDINANLPNYTEFVGASEGGHWTGSNIRWDNLTVSPHGNRHLQYSVRVRSDAPNGASIRAGVVAQGNEAYDLTVVGAPRGNTGTPVAVAPTPVVRGALSKVASRSEVKPGDTIAYTIVLRNTTNAPFANVTVEDRYDPNVLRILEEAGVVATPGKLQWNIPVLQPGDQWKVTYRMQVHPQLPHGKEISNIVSAHGEGLERVSLTERVRTSSIAVVSNLPKTGASFDAIFLLTTGLMSIAPAGVAARRKHLS